MPELMTKSANLIPPFASQLTRCQALTVCGNLIAGRVTANENDVRRGESTQNWPTNHPLYDFFLFRMRLSPSAPPADQM